MYVHPKTFVSFLISILLNNKAHLQIMKKVTEMPHNQIQLENAILKQLKKVVVQLGGNFVGCKILLLHYAHHSRSVRCKTILLIDI